MQVWNSYSDTFKNMLKVREQVMKVFDRRIANGQNTKLWFDPWLEGSRIINRLGSTSLARLGGDNLKVSKIIVNRQWRPNLLEHTRSFSNEIM